ncbi:Iojap-related protein, partial [human gut metagenome]
MESKELAIRLARALDAKKGYNIRILHVENLTTVTDYFVIATGNSTTHVGALADEADFQLGRAGVNVLRTEGHDGNRWVLLDYGSVIVHVFTPEAHDFYDLEHLWADAKELPAEEWEEKPEVVNFTDIQLYIYDQCPHEELTIIMRRYMMRIAEHFARKDKCLGL